MLSGRFRVELRETALSSPLLGWPMPKEAALSESVRVTAITCCLALEAGRDGVGACSFKLSSTKLVCAGAEGRRSS